MRKPGSAGLRLFLVASLAGCVDSTEVVEETKLAVCCGSTCCHIQGLCRSNGDLNPANNCESCQPSQSQVAWTPIFGCNLVDAGVDTGNGTPPDAGLQDTGALDVGPGTLDASTSSDAGATADASAPNDASATADPDDAGPGCGLGQTGDRLPLAGLLLLLFVAIRHPRHED